MRLQPLLVFCICALVPFAATGTIPRRRSGFEGANYNYDVLVKDTTQLEDENKEIDERRSGRRNPSLNSGLIFGKRFEEAAEDFLNDDESRQINLVSRGRSRLPFHSGLMQGKRNPLQDNLSVKRSRPQFHTGFMMGKRFTPEADDFDLEEFKRKAGQRLRFSDGMLFGK
uniref:L-type SALMFamide neuropeptide n=1 Tax=Ophionotus victoriae TaxID=667017 RepID=A0A0B5IVP7_9ECHI|nr:L-type SALMFamide neuropeptide precursor [Ophionotus victoriae]ASK86260.1 SALMfamide L-type precursor [Ophionotus victoriae]